MAFSFLSISVLPLPDAAVLAQTAPFFAALYARIFLKEPWHMSEFLAALSGIAGVVFIARPASLFEAHAVTTTTSSGIVNRSLGVVYGMISAAGAGGAYVTVRLLGTKVKVYWAVVMLYQALGQALYSIPVILVTGVVFASLKPHQIALALGTGFLGFWSQVAMTKGMQREKSAIASVVRQGLAPIFSFLWQALFLPGDPMEWTAAVGFTIVLIGLVVAVLGKARRDASPVQEGKDAAPTSKDPTSPTCDSIQNGNGIDAKSTTIPVCKSKKKGLKYERLDEDPDEDLNKIQSAELEETADSTAVNPDVIGSRV